MEVGRPDLWASRTRPAVSMPSTPRYVTMSCLRLAVSGHGGRRGLHELAREESDESQEGEIEALRWPGHSAGRARVAVVFTGEHDEVDAIVSIMPKYGGVDAQDWPRCCCACTPVGRVPRLRCGYRRVSEGTEAGIMSAQFTIHGRYAYGLMACERGPTSRAHQPVSTRRLASTSFAAVEVWPMLEDLADVEIPDSSWHGGVRASGAVASTSTRRHRPFGWSPADRVGAASQEERSQLQNRGRAMARLTAMLATQREQDRQAELDRIAGKQAQSDGPRRCAATCCSRTRWSGSATNYETGNVQAVLDGEVQPFMEPSSAGAAQLR